MSEITNKSNEQKVAEAEVDSFRKNLGPFVVAAETTRMAHDLLTRENWHSAALRDVINGAMEPFGVADGRAERIVITGELAS